MSRFIEKIREASPADLMTDLAIANLFPRSPDQRYALVKRAIAKGELIHIRRGLYYLGRRYQRGPLNLFAIAQQVYAPSYVSFESALSHHGWIPEAVRTVTSSTSKRSRSFETPLGRFIYIHVSCHPFLTGIFYEKSGADTFWIAPPCRAIADYVAAYKKDWRGISPLLKSLRIEEEDLANTSREELLQLEAIYRSRLVKRFLRGVRKDLSL